MTFINKLFRDEAGATAIEYGLIAALIAVASIVALQNLSGELQNTFNTTSTKMSEANDAAGGSSTTTGGTTTGGTTP